MVCIAGSGLICRI